LLTQTDPNGTRTWALTRENGELISESVKVFGAEDGEHCFANFLPIRSCSCTQVQGGAAEGLMRLFLAMVTVGITELIGAGDLGAGNEQGVVLTRWVEGGVEHTLAPTKAPKNKSNSRR
jgi:hypothetical protein